MPKTRENKKYREGNSLVLFLLGLVLMAMMWAGACVTTQQTAKGPAASPEAAVIRSVHLRSVGNGAYTLLEVIGTAPIRYTAFKLEEPPRLVIDLDAPLAEKLRPVGPVNDRYVKDIEFQKVKGKSKTRLVIELGDDVKYDVESQNEVVSVTLGPGQTEKAQEMASVENKPSAPGAATEGEGGTDPSHEPRIFFKPKDSSLNQILGVDFTMLEGGKSRLIITTDKKTPFHIEREGGKVLALKLDNASIPSLLQKHLDSSQFDGAVDRVKAYVSGDQVTLKIALREMVPFHVDQGDKAITIDFGPSNIKPPKTKIVPVALAEKGKMNTPEVLKVDPIPGAATKLFSKRKARKRYTGTPMTMDFVNADVTNILRLIGEVSNLNIIWSPKVKGKVSMRLRNVPWDQALDLVLKNNNLAMRREGNVIWVTTRDQMAKIEAEEKKKQEDLEKRRQEQLKRAKELKALEPVMTEYITINYVDVENVKKVIEDTVKSPRGKITVDKNTKTIIMTDTASKIREARELARRLDRATKQVMIEARIVEAATSFSRDLGIQWNAEFQHRSDTGVPWNGTPAWAPNNTPANYPFGNDLSNPSFSTNHPNFTPNLGLVFTTLSASGLTGAFLNTQIALSESEGELKVLSSPKIVTRDTVTATIQQGTKIVLPSGTDSNGNKVYELVDASLKLEVTPHITPNNMVVMNVKINDDFPDYANARGDNVPIQTKSAETTMMVASGDTVIIGGIYKENKGVSETGQPWLKDIPIIGWLFKNKTWNNTKRELLIFLTPTVLPAG